MAPEKVLDVRLAKLLDHSFQRKVRGRTARIRWRGSSVKLPRVCVMGHAGNEPLDVCSAEFSLGELNADSVV